MKNSKLLGILIALCISASIFANSTGFKPKFVAFDNEWQNGRSGLTLQNLPFKNTTVGKHEDQHTFKVVDNPNFDYLNFSYKKEKSKNDRIACLNTITPCNNPNQAIDITDGHINNGRHGYARKHNSDQSLLDLDTYSYNGRPDWVYYNHNLSHHGSNDQFNNNNDNGNGNHNGNNNDDGGCINPPSQLPVVPAPQAVFLTSTGLWVVSWLRRRKL